MNLVLVQTGRVIAGVEASSTRHGHRKVGWLQSRANQESVTQGGAHSGEIANGGLLGDSGYSPW